MPATHCPNRESLVAFMQGHVADMQAASIAQHLDECTTCDETATALENAADPFIAELVRPTGDASVFSDGHYRLAVDRIASLGRSPSSIGVAADAAAAGKEFGQYVLLEKIGQGGMGAVYKAIHSRLEKVVAVKILPQDRTQDEMAISRFDREMKAVGRLDHPNIIRAMDAGEADDMHYLVMEYVEGLDLSRLSKQGPLTIADACEVVRQAALGLSHAHKQGLVHRDVKPSNLMLSWVRSDDDSEGEEELQSAHVKILDMGLALLSDGQHELTDSGQMMGTLDYMAPEQGGDSHEVDARADVYSLGATLYRLLVGEPIYHGPKYQTHVQKMMALVNTPAPDIQTRRSDIPDALAAIVHRTIAHNPQQRFSSAAEVASALAPFTNHASLARLLSERLGAVGAEPPVWNTSGSATAPERLTASAVDTSVSKPAKPITRPSAKAGWIIGSIATAALLLIGTVLLAVFLFRTPDGTIVVEIDDKYQDEVKVEVTRGSGVIQISAEEGWRMKLTPGTYEVDVAGVDDRFVLEKETITIERGEETIVRVKFHERIVPHTKEKTQELGQQAIAWIEKHNAIGPDLVDDARGKIEEEAARGKGFIYAFAGSLMKSERPTVVAVYGNRLFDFELTDEQEAQMGLANQALAVCTVGFAPIGKRAIDPEFELVSADLAEVDAEEEGRELSGWATYQRKRESEIPDTHYWVRLTIGTYKPVTLYQGLAGDLATETGRLQIKVDNPWPQGGPKARVGFVEVGRFDKSDDDYQNFVALSDPLPVVVMFEPTSSSE